MIATLAARQHGVGGQAQLLEAGNGAPRDRATNRSRPGSTRFTAGCPPWATPSSSQSGRWRPPPPLRGGVLSHRWAGALWGHSTLERRIQIRGQWTRPARHSSPSTSRPRQITPTPASSSPPRAPAARLAGVLLRHQLQQAIKDGARGHPSEPNTNRGYPTNKGTAALRAWRRPPTREATSGPASTPSLSDPRRSRRLGPTSSSRKTGRRHVARARPHHRARRLGVPTHEAQSKRTAAAAATLPPRVARHPRHLAGPGRAGRFGGRAQRSSSSAAPRASPGPCRRRRTSTRCRRARRASRGR